MPTTGPTYAQCWCGHRHDPARSDLAYIGYPNPVLVCSCRRCFVSLALTRRLGIEQLTLAWKAMHR